MKLPKDIVPGSVYPTVTIIGNCFLYYNPG